MTEMEFRKISIPAESRMRARTAKEQLAATLEALKGPDDIPDPDSDDSSMQGYWPSLERPCYR